MAKAAQHKEKIVRSAVRLFREKGYAGTGLAEILELSGAPKGSLYHYFPGGKDELTIAAVESAGEVVASTLKTLAAESQSPQEFVQHYCHLLAGWMEASNYKAGCPIATVILETVPKSVELTQACQAVYESWTTIIASVYLNAGHSETESFKKAKQIMALIQGRLLLTRLYQSTELLRDCDNILV